MIEQGCVEHSGESKNNEIRVQPSPVAPVVSCLVSRYVRDGGRFALEADVGDGMPYYRWFPIDYAGDALVKAMTDDQDLAYRRLLDISWQIGSLPSDLGELARLAGFDSERFEAAWSFPLTECWHKNGAGKLVNHRLEEERESTLKRSEKARQSVQAREKKRGKRLRAKRKASIIERSSNDHRAMIYPKPDPDPDPDPKKEKRKKKPRSPQFKINWDEKQKLWVGEDLDKLKTYLKDKYVEEFSYNWVYAIWNEIIDKHDINDHVLAWTDPGAGIVGWFARSAKWKREKE